MQTKQTNKGGASGKSFSLATLISVLGLVILGFVLYFGFAYAGQNTGTAILFAILITLGFGVLLYGLLYAKGADDHFKGWAVAEVIMLVAFIGGAAATVPVMSGFLTVNGASDELSQVANDDLDQISQMIKTFQEKASGNLNTMSTQMESLVARGNLGQTTTPELQEALRKASLMGENSTNVSMTDVNAWQNNWGGYINNVYDPTSGGEYGPNWQETIDLNRQRIESWSILDIPQAMNDIDALSAQVSETLARLSGEYPFHNIVLNGTRWDDGGIMTLPKEEYKARFKAECAEKTGFSASGAVLSAVIFLIILFNYLVAYRSRKVGIKGGSLLHDGGMILQP